MCSSDLMDTPQVVRPQSVSASMVALLRRPSPVARFTSLPSSVEYRAVSPCPAPYVWPSVAPAAPAVQYTAPVVASPQVLTATRSSPSAFRTIQANSPSSMLVSPMDGRTVVAQGAVPSNGVRPARSGMKRPSLQLLLAGRHCATCQVHLYQAPFSPSLCYKDGEELFRVPAGWAALRTKGGLLMWLELGEDSLLSEAIRAQATKAPRPSRPGSSSPGSPPTKDGDGRRRTASTRLVPFALTLQLLASNGGRQVSARSRGCCSIDSAIRLPLEDMLVLHPTGGEGTGIRASLTVATEGPGRGGVDGAFKAWLSFLATSGGYDFSA